jgi:iron-sulfur cluster repair protein YtfE (RIC family)
MRTEGQSRREAQPAAEIVSPLAVLAADHERVAHIAEEFQAALEGGRDDTRDLMDQLCRELEMHTLLEEEILYPAAAQVAELAILVEEAHADHARVREVIDEIREMDGTDEQLAGLVLQLAEDVEQHVSEEENVLFPQLEQRLGERMQELGWRMQQLRARLAER